MIIPPVTVYVIFVLLCQNVLSASNALQEHSLINLLEMRSVFSRECEKLDSQQNSFDSIYISINSRVFTQIDLLEAKNQNVVDSDYFADLGLHWTIFMNLLAHDHIKEISDARLEVIEEALLFRQYQGLKHFDCICKDLNAAIKLFKSLIERESSIEVLINE